VIPEGISPLHPKNGFPVTKEKKKVGTRRFYKEKVCASKSTSSYSRGGESYVLKEGGVLSYSRTRT